MRFCGIPSILETLGCNTSYLPKSGRGCVEYQCESLIEQNHSIRNLPEPETRGIFVIKENNVIIYIGKSGDCMRERLLSHLAGYDAQEIGKYMKTLSKEQKMQTITVGWVKVQAPSCDEHHYIECLAKRQNQWPKCNLKRGRPVKKE